MSTKAQDPAQLAIRAKPRPVKRFNPKALFLGVGGAVLMVFGAFAFAMQSPERGEGTTPKELYNTNANHMADGLAELPTSYAEIKPQLGPPLPGDLGAAFLANGRFEEPRENPFKYEPSRLQSQSPATTSGHTRRGPSKSEQIAKARAAPLFFIERKPTGNASTGQARSAQAVAGLYHTGFDENGSFAASTDPNNNQGKEEFFGAEVDTNIYNPHRLQTPVSPYQIMAGTIIPASLITGINSDLPGQTIAHITENVYDTVTGEILLIPQGSKLMGRYDNVIAFGQSRALVVWTRLIMPDGSSLTIENLPGVDPQGYAGLEDKVDYHTWRVAKAAILSSLLGASAELGRSSDDSEILDAIRDGSQRTVNHAGQRIVERNLDIQPTITIRPGWRLRVIVNQDLILKPYGKN